MKSFLLILGVCAATVVGCKALRDLQWTNNATAAALAMFTTNSSRLLQVPIEGDAAKAQIMYAYRALTTDAMIDSYKRQIKETRQERAELVERLWLNQNTEAWLTMQLKTLEAQR